MLKSVIVVHHHEITLKGNNRKYFESRLLKNLQIVLKGYPEVERIFGGYGRFVIELSTDLQIEQICKDLSCVFGLSNICAGLRIDQDIEIFKTISERLLQPMKISSLKVDSRRSDKRFPLKSMEINSVVGAHLCNRFQVRADMTNPDVTIYIEIADGNAFIYLAKSQGIGGLPIGVSGRVVSLLSAGFDSPVASWRMMKRGASVIFVHFHSIPYTSQNSLDQVIQLVRVLTKYQYKSKLYFVPFADVQNEIVLHSPPPLRIILYRRMMIRIAEIVARREKAEALVTGEAVGQVASQTLRNIRVIDEAATFPILRPLSGMDKEETMDLARKIGTFEISNEPFDDCCSFLAPRSPETWAKLEQVQDAELKFDIETLVRDTVKKISIEEFDYLDQIKEKASDFSS
ncbi:MAG: tRNA uracil 4-sulfurtransferase ThiI [Bacteroidota bacterium]